MNPFEERRELLYCNRLILKLLECLETSRLPNDLIDHLEYKKKLNDLKIKCLMIEIEGLRKKEVPKEGEPIMEFGDGFRSVLLYGADENCHHVNDPLNYDGIQCMKCDGWYCV